MNSGSVNLQSQIDQLLQYYRYIEEEPIRRLESQKADIKDKTSIYDELKSKLKTLSGKALDFTGVDSLSPFQEKEVQYSSEDYVKFEVGKGAQPNNYSIKVNQLAKYDTVISDQITLANSDMATSLGVGDHVFTIAYGSTSRDITVSIAADDTNEDILNNITQAINDESDFNVSASVVKDTDNTGRLNISSTETGSNNKLTITDNGSNIVSVTGFGTSAQASGTSGGYLYAASELDASFVLNGITITRSENVLDDVIKGTTISLLNPQQASDNPVTVSVNNNTDEVRSNIDDFIDSYNKVIDYLNDKTKVNTTTYTRGPLTGDMIAQKVKTQLRTMLLEQVTSANSDGPSYLFEIGITFDDKGKMEVSDSDKLTEKLENSLSDVESMFNTSDGFGTRLDSWLDDFLGADGSITTKKESLNSQIRYIDLRVDSLNKAVDSKMAYYAKQFTALQSAMYAAQAQLSSVTQMSNYLY